MDIVEDLNAGEPANAETTPVETVAEQTPEAPPQTEVTPEETPAQQEARERDEKGRFKAKPDDQTMVPLTALHETRDKVRNLEAELEKLRTPTPAPEPQAVPDIFEDPQGFTGHIDSKINQAVANAVLNLSEDMVRKAVGNDVVNEAQQWGGAEFAKNPALYHQFISQPNPYEFLVEQYKRASVVAKLSEDPSQIEAFLAWQKSQSAPAPQPTPPPAIPTSLAAEQSSRGGAAPYQPPSLEDILGRKT